MWKILVFLALFSSPALAGGINLQFNIEVERHHSWCHDHSWECYHNERYREWREYHDYEEWQARRDYREYCRERWEDGDRCWHRHHFHHHHW